MIVVTSSAKGKIIQTPVTLKKGGNIIRPNKIKPIVRTLTIIEQDMAFQLTEETQH